jgi:UDP-N-acetylglucosamine 4-epimerase
MTKTLVIGGNGYIGRHMKIRFPNFIYVGRNEFDLNNKEQIHAFCKNLNIEKCIILSATISYEDEIDFNKEPFSTNLAGLNNLLSILKKLNEEMNIIYFSSMTVYDKNAISPVLESSALAPLHTYGLSKVYAESLVRYYAMKSVIIRIPGIYGGDRKSGLIYNTLQKLKNNENVTIDTTGLGYWETLHIDDMLDMFSSFLDSYRYSSEYEVFNIAYGEKTDMVETIHFLKDKLESKSIININAEYQKLYLSNRKVLQFSNLEKSYFERLELYIRSCDV